MCANGANRAPGTTQLCKRLFLEEVHSTLTFWSEVHLHFQFNGNWLPVQEQYVTIVLRSVTYC